MNGCHSGLASTEGRPLATDAQLEAEARVRQLEEELKLEKNVQVSTALPALGLADKMREQDCKLEILACHMAKLGEHKLLQINVQVL